MSATSSRRAAVGMLLSTGFLAITVVVPVSDAAQAVRPELAQKALAVGSVRVIVHLGTRTTPEGLLADGRAVHMQRQAIVTAQNAILGALHGTSHRVLHRYETMPLLTLELGPGPLAILDALGGAISRVEEDDLTLTMGPAASHVVIDVAGYLGPKP